VTAAKAAPPPTTAEPAPISIATAKAPEPDYATMRVFFATDRAATGKTKPDEVFGTGRGSSITYGTCDVSIPREHRMGALESPSIWRLEFREDPARHVVLMSVAREAKEDFFSHLATSLRNSKQSNAFVFVHGYNVTFEDAARRTAQIAYDLGFNGAPVFYSWPSEGETAKYTVDEQSVEWATSNLKGFLSDFFAKSTAQNIYLVAHSMGNRALTRATADLLAEQPALRGRLKEVILTAPDIDADVFERDIAPKLAEAGRPITLYASSTDLALKASKEVHGFPRAGDAGPGIVVTRGIETIDATGVDTSLLGHSYFADTKSVLSDIFQIVSKGSRADERRTTLQPVNAPAGRYWIFRR
jgi:esterase/lipase superfamily enzyme